MRFQPPSPPGALPGARTTVVVSTLLAVLAVLAVLGVLLTSWSPEAAGATAWRWPLQPRPTVLRRFAPPAQPWDAGRRGVELAAAVDQPVRAPAAGVIVFAGVVAGIPTVSIDHGDLVSTYQPVGTTLLGGTPVATGAVVGTVRALPRLCGATACLRWGVYVDGSSPRRYADPLALVGAAPVRLLPPTVNGEVGVAAEAGSDPGVAATANGHASPVGSLPSSRPSRRVGALPTAAVPVTLVAGGGIALAGAVAGRRRVGGRSRGRGRAGLTRQDR